MFRSKKRSTLFHFKSNYPLPPIFVEEIPDLVTFVVLNIRFKIIPLHQTGLKEGHNNEIRLGRHRRQGSRLRTWSLTQTPHVSPSLHPQETHTSFENYNFLYERSDTEKVNALNESGTHSEGSGGECKLGVLYRRSETGRDKEREPRDEYVVFWSFRRVLMTWDYGSYFLVLFYISIKKDKNYTVHEMKDKVKYKCSKR